MKDEKGLDYFCASMMIFAIIVIYLLTTLN